MKKFIAIVLTFLISTLNSCYAFSELYYLKNTTSDKIKPIVTNSLMNRDFSLIKQNPYYATSRYDSSEYAVIVVQQSGNDVFYYYQSNNNKKVNKDILKSVKNYGIDYEQSMNSNVISIYDNIAQRLLTNSSEINNYSFDEPEQVVHLSGYPANVQSQQRQVTSNTMMKGAVVQVASGTKLKVYLQNPINTSSANKGDSVIAVLTDNLSYNGYVVAPQGSVLHGALTKARSATYGSRNGRVVIEFNTLITPDGQQYSISTEKIDFTVANDGKIQRTVSSAATGALIGALAGLVFGAIGDGNLLSATAIGAGVGAGTAVVSGVAERGVDAEIPSFTEMEVTLSKPIRATVNY